MVQYITTSAILSNRSKIPTATWLRHIIRRGSVVEEPGSARLTLWGGEDCCVHELARRTLDFGDSDARVGFDAAVRCGGFEESWSTRLALGLGGVRSNYNGVLARWTLGMADALVYSAT